MNVEGMSEEAKAVIFWAGVVLVGVLHHLLTRRRDRFTLTHLRGGQLHTQEEAQAGVKKKGGAA